MDHQLEDLTVADVAREVGVIPNTVRLWTRHPEKPCPHAKRDGRLWFNLDAVRDWMAERRLTGRPGRPADVCDENLEAVRLRKESALADKYEMQVDRERREVIPAVDVQARWAALVGEARAVFLAVPAAVATRCVGHDAGEIQTILDAAFVDALLTLSGGQSAGVVESS